MTQKQTKAKSKKKSRTKRPYNKNPNREPLGDRFFFRAHSGKSKQLDDRREGTGLSRCEALRYILDEFLDSGKALPKPQIETEESEGYSFIIENKPDGKHITIIPPKSPKA